jgi:hypothetical protein
MMTATEILNSFSASFWLKDAIKSALKRDPVDALRDAEALVEVLKRNADTKKWR